MIKNPGTYAETKLQKVSGTTKRRITTVSIISGFLQYATTHHHTHTCCIDSVLHRSSFLSVPPVL